MTLTSNVRRLGPIMLMLSVLGLLVAGIVISEPGSAFDGPHAPAAGLLETASEESMDVQRSVAGPLSLERDTALDPHSTIIAIVAPSKPYSEAEVDAIERLVASGVSLLVVDDFHESNSLTTGFGMVIERVRLVESSGNYTFRATVGSSGFDVHYVNTTAIRYDRDLDIEVLAESSAASFLDRDGDGLIGESDPHGPFPVALLKPPQGTSGSIAVVASLHSLASPSDADGPDGNQAFIRHLLRTMVPDGGAVLVIDESRTESSNPIVQATRALASAPLQMPWRPVFIGVLLVGLAGALALASKDLLPVHRFLPDQFIRRQGPDPSESSGRDRHDGPGGRGGLTAEGHMAVLGGVSLSAAAVLYGNLQAAAGAAMLFIAVGASMQQPGFRATRIRRELSRPQAAENDVIEVRLTMASQGRRRSLLDYYDRLPATFELADGDNRGRTVMTSEEVTAEYRIKPAVAGKHRIGPLELVMFDPLQLHYRRIEVEEDCHLKVVPSTQGLQALPIQNRKSQVTIGPHMVNKAGRASEFHSLRDYQQGDSIRIVNWKASARSKNLVVNQRVHDSMTRVMLLLDGREVTAKGRSASTPWVVGCRVAASLLQSAVRMRDRIDLVVYGVDTRRLGDHVASAQVHRMMDMIVDCVPSGGMSMQQAVDGLLDMVVPGAPFVVVSGFEDDPSAVQAVRQLLVRGAMVSVVAVPLSLKPARPEDGPPEAGMEAILRARKQALSQIRSMGVPVYDMETGMPIDHMVRVGAV